MIQKLKKVNIQDVLGIFIFVIVLFPSILFKLYLKILKKELWLVCETKNTARDNGYIFYKYMKEIHPEIKCYYAINKNVYDYEKVKKYGNIIKWGGFKHYFYYMSATKNISSHKEGNPNHPLFTVLHLYMNLFNNRVFLQHGVLYQDFPMFHKKNTKFKIFITGTKPEYDYVSEKYGYADEVKYTGLARFDNLHDYKTDDKCILLIPTWRRWLDTSEKFENSEYFKRLNSLINNQKLIELLEKNDKYIYFYPHLSTQKFMDCYKINNERVKIVYAQNVDVQDLLRKGSLLITDFSSIFTDFAYMYKPIIYYQYDAEQFYKKHVNIDFNTSYFSFKKDGYGEIIDNEDALIEIIKGYIDNGFKMKSDYKNRVTNSFILHDKNNCERIYEQILNSK